MCRFKRATFTLEALSPAQLAADACNAVQQVDQQLLERKTVVSAFEADFRKVGAPMAADQQRRLPVAFLGKLMDTTAA